jgi:hypothetical protein
MKTKFSVTTLLIVFVLSSFTLSTKDLPTTKDEGIPENIQAVINKSCFGCHNSDSKNEDAKEELDFKKLEKLSKIKKISAYKNIAETVEEEKMPPKKFLDRYPDKKLTDEEKKALIDWAKKEAMALVKSE